MNGHIYMNIFNCRIYMDLLFYRKISKVKKTKNIFDRKLPTLAKLVANFFLPGYLLQICSIFFK